MSWTTTSKSYSILANKVQHHMAQSFDMIYLTILTKPERAVHERYLQALRIPHALGLMEFYQQSLGTWTSKKID